jgi:hypothetical protein
LFPRIDLQNTRVWEKSIFEPHIDLEVFTETASFKNSTSIVVINVNESSSTSTVLVFNENESLWEEYW